MPIKDEREVCICTQRHGVRERYLRTRHSIMVCKSHKSKKSIRMMASSRVDIPNPIASTLLVRKSLPRTNRLVSPNRSIKRPRKPHARALQSQHQDTGKSVVTSTWADRCSHLLVGLGCLGQGRLEEHHRGKSVCRHLVAC